MIRLMRDERGLELVEWLALGTVMLVLVGTIYAASNGSARLRQAIAATMDHYASTFGADVLASSPAQASSLASTASDTGRDESLQLTFAALPPSSRPSSVFLPDELSYLVFPPGSSAPLRVGPAAGVSASISPGTAQLILRRPGQHRGAVLDLAQRQVDQLDLITNVRVPTSLAQLQREQLLTIVAGPPRARVAPVPPALGIVALASALLPGGHTL